MSQPALGSLGQLDVHALVSQALLQLLYLEVDDLRHVLAGELAEYYDLVDAIQELGPEGTLQALRNVVCESLVLTQAGIDLEPQSATATTGITCANV